MVNSMYAMFYDDGKINMLVATDITYNECVKIRSKQEKPECYKIIQITPIKQRARS